MVSASRDRVEGTVARIRRSDDCCARSVGALRRSRYRLQSIRGGGDGGDGGDPRLPDLSTLSVVIVEEDTDNLELFATFLRACGAHVIPTTSVDRALQFLEQTTADVIMTDVSVLPMGGPQFSEAVRRLPRHEHTPILAVTGWSEKDARTAECGFTAFMHKPVDLDRLGAELLRLARTEAARVGPLRSA